jgi:outer membrane protein
MTQKILIALLTVALAIVAVSLFMQSNTRDKLGYVKLNEVYEKFAMRAEMHNKYKSVEILRKNLLDSLEFKAKAVQASGDQEKYEFALNDYLGKRKEMEESNEVLSRQYEEQIWNQINSYCKEYGQREGYDFIFGAEGSGNIMFAGEQKELTSELIEFINKRYHGQKENSKK